MKTLTVSSGKLQFSVAWRGLNGRIRGGWSRLK